VIGVGAVENIVDAREDPETETEIRLTGNPGFRRVRPAPVPRISVAAGADEIRRHWSRDDLGQVTERALRRWYEPDTAQYEIDRYDLPNLKAMNFYVHGILRDGVSSNSRLDGQAKSLGEYLRSKYIEAPASITAEVVA